MGIRLVDDDNDVSVPLDLDHTFLHAVAVQLQRADATEGSPFPRRFVKILLDTLGQALDTDIKPPSDAQLKFALDIARELGIAIPGEALRYRGSMTAFIARFEPALRERRRSQRI